MIHLMLAKVGKTSLLQPKPSRLHLMHIQDPVVNKNKHNPRLKLNESNDKLPDKLSLIIQLNFHNLFIESMILIQLDLTLFASSF